MKVAKGGIERALDQPDGSVRLYLFYGPDEGQSRSHGERLLKALGATRFVANAGAVRSDPALLADEAGAMSLFGEPRAIWVEPAGDEIADGVDALLSAPASESPVIVIAGALRKTSALLKLAEGHPLALAHISYIPEGDFLKLADLALSGELSQVSQELARLSSGGSEAIPVIRALQRRLLMLAPMRARVDSGERSGAVMASLGKSLFWKDKPLIETLLGTWDARGLETVAERAGKLERSLMRGDAPPPSEALGEELTAIARRAARRR